MNILFKNNLNHYRAGYFYVVAVYLEAIDTWEISEIYEKDVYLKDCIAIAVPPNCNIFDAATALAKELTQLDLIKDNNGRSIPDPESLMRLINSVILTFNKNKFNN